MSQDRILWIKSLIAVLSFTLGIGIVSLVTSWKTSSQAEVDLITSFQRSNLHQQSPERPLEMIESEEQYPGTTIDEVFPILANRSFDPNDSRNNAFEFEVDDYQVGFSNFGPRSLKKDHKNLLRIATKYPEYHSSLIGTSSLLGVDSKQLYMVAGGPGAVCCTNYWIVDISDNRPRMIFRSEDYGHFRDAMEIFDYEGDGVYELMQYDSCFRYFMGDCGTCSPEPRVYFRFDKRTGQYLPASGISEDFVRGYNQRTEARLIELADSTRLNPDPGESLELDRLALSFFVDLLHRGEKKKAWRVFRKFHSKPSKEMLREIDKTLDSCAFYQAISKN